MTDGESVFAFQVVSHDRVEEVDVAAYERIKPGKLAGRGDSRQIVVKRSPRRSRSPVKRQHLDDGRGLLELPDVLVELGVSRPTLYRLMDTGELHYVQVSPRKRKFKRSDVDAFVARARR